MDNNDSTTPIKQAAMRTIEIEQHALASLKERIDDTFENACKLILACAGRVIVTGVGKSGHIGNKIAATLASTGTPAFFMHSAEASHGDLGMITEHDIVIAISYSGNTEEVVKLVPLIKRINAPLISVTGNPNSALAQASQFHLNVNVKTEACPLNLAPTSSTTCTLAMGDALAVALLDARGFSADDFAFSHPGGALGKRLLLKVSDLMSQELPAVNPNDSLKLALLEISAKGLGITTILDQQQRLLGTFTDGDLRRALDENINIHDTTIDKLMTTQCKTVSKDTLAAEALNKIEKFGITSLIVVDADNKPCGIIHLHALVKAGLA